MHFTREIHHFDYLCNVKFNYILNLFFVFRVWFRALDILCVFSHVYFYKTHEIATILFRGESQSTR